MSSHLYFISVKRLRIEKGTSEDADKFEAVADTGRSENMLFIFLPRIFWVSFTRILFVSEFEQTESSLQANDISVSYISKIWISRYSKTLKTKISDFFLSFLSRLMYQTQHICGSSYCLDMTILSLYTKLVYNHEMISICYVLLETHMK